MGQQTFFVRRNISQRFFLEVFGVVRVFTAFAAVFQVRISLLACRLCLSGIMVEECVFCSIVGGKSRSFKVYEDEGQLAFLDIHPLVKGHTLVVPKRHFDTLLDMDEESIGKLFATVKLVARVVVQAMGAQGFRIMQNNGESAAQVVKHVHVHILPFRLGESSFGLKRLTLTEEELSRIAKQIREQFDLLSPASVIRKDSSSYL